MHIRIATTDDTPVLAMLHIEGWKAAYGGTVDQAYLDSLDIESRTKNWADWMATGESRVFIAEEGVRPCGFIAWGRTRTPPPGSSPIRPSHSAEVYALYLHPDVWRRGAGTALLRHAVQDMKVQKHLSFCLWVLDANARAKSFYAANGGQKLGGKIVEIGPTSLKEVCYGWRDLSGLL